jgi:hypothetical protein
LVVRGETFRVAAEHSPKVEKKGRKIDYWHSKEDIMNPVLLHKYRAGLLTPGDFLVHE